jgi:hypothetical protein
MRWHALLLPVALLALGCGPRLGAVKGRVTLGGQPLANAAVNFQPVGNEVNPGIGSSGRTDANGEYSLSLIDGKGNGAIVGRHRVMIRSINPASGEDDRTRPPADRVPRRYNMDSELTFDVKPGSNVANFDLKSK